MINKIVDNQSIHIFEQILNKLNIEKKRAKKYFVDDWLIN